MPSILSGFEYDVFISYRHNDNRSGWVTEFIKSLQEELSATIKEPISIYFDANPHDGLLETHSVDKSLEGKLKCLVFIPILSQTYCDTKSFAWQHEFCAFNKLAREETFGRDIMLGNGNVASRILPVKIHDLDGEDKATIEQELGGALRAIDFIFKSSGVNRPLTPTDKRDENLNRVFYRDQINKLANAVKEIVSASKSKNHSAELNITRTTIAPGKSLKKTIALTLAGLVVMIGSYFLYSFFNNPSQELSIDKSIAVLPFTDMSPGHDQEYLGDGIAEDIINALTKINELKVIGRFSSFQFKGEKVDLREVGAKLNVATVLEGSVMKSGNKVRITAQLINVNDGVPIWSERFEREMEDIFSIQDEISSKITQKLAASFLKKSQREPAVAPTSNMEAYEMTMRGNFFLRQGPTGSGKAKEYFEKAIQLDSNYAEAQLGYAGTYFFSGGTAEMNRVIGKLRSLNADSRAVAELMILYYMWRQGDWANTMRIYDSLTSNSVTPSITLAYCEAAILGDMKKAVRTLEKVVELDPLYLDGLRNLAMFYLYAGEFDKANKTIQKLFELNSGYIDVYLLKADAYLREKKFSNALEECALAEERFKNKSLFLNTRIRALAGLGKMDEALKLFTDLKVEEDPAYQWALAGFYFPLGLEEKAFAWLDSAALTNPPFMIIVLIDPNFDPYRNDPRFRRAVAKLNLPKGRK